jgi:hypothetical protein
VDFSNVEQVLVVLSPPPALPSPTAGDKRR